jgi:hypothetical protein
MDLLQFARNRRPPSLEGDSQRRPSDTGYKARRDAPLESADGQHLYYVKLPQNLLWRLPLAGGKESEVLPAVAAFGTAYALGKQGIYFIRPDGQGSGQELAFLGFANSQVTSLVVTIPRAVTFGLALSPDERLILYSQIDQVSSDLMLVENFHG